MRVNFHNAEGQKLTGSLEMPATAPRAFALVAHCFTCSKDSKAAHVISKTLRQMEIGVLRFDFTGLGDSQGDFSETNFSSNVSDIVHACAYLRDQYREPEILIGHSLGGAAVLKAAMELSYTKAVVTIAAPSSVSHVANILEKDIETIRTKGQAEVSIAGRSFTLKRQFIEDIGETKILDGLKRLRKALLVMHAPLDEIVSIDHAAAIFKAAKHPKSFITLDNADHLLTRRGDGEYAAKVIAAWVDRYISPKVKGEAEGEPGKVRVVSRNTAQFTQDIYTADHHIVADEPVSFRGDNRGMNPYELLLAGLGACTSMTMKMYAARKDFPLEKVEVQLSHDKVHAEDCDNCETKKGKIDRITKAITLTGSLDKEQKRRLYEIAEKCPVNRTLRSEILIETDHNDTQAEKNNTKY